jgi:hypothetical protein
VSSPIAIGAAELALAAALMARARATTAYERAQTEAFVARARSRLDALKTIQLPLERTCCGLPMTFHSGQWICTAGHD